MVRTVFVLLLCSQIIFGQAFAGSVNIEGTITNRLSNKIKFSYFTYEKNWLQETFHGPKEELKKDGSFSVSLPVEHDYTLLRITNGSETTEIYVSPGDRLKMSVDCENFDETISFKGSGADIANLMAKYTLKYGLISSFYKEVRKATLKDKDEFLADLNKLIQDRTDFLIDNSPGLPQSFVKFWDADFEYRKYNAMLNYPRMHEMLKHKSYDVEIDPDNYSVAKKVPTKFKDAYLSIGSYRDYADDYYDVIMKINGSDKGEIEYFYEDKKLELAHQNMPRSTEEYVFAKHIAKYMKHNPLKRMLYCYNIFSERYSGSDYSKYLEGLIEQKRKLMAGAPAIDFVVRDEEGKKYSLKDLRGKVVYLDFWASWCGPCKAQFPHTKKIKEHFKGQDVVFVYISVDEDEEKWQEAKKKYHLTGLHALGEKDWKSKVVQEYGVNSIPSYFLINKEGKFALDVVPRPSQKEELIQAIEQLL